MSITYGKAIGLSEAAKQKLGRLFPEMKPSNHKSDGTAFKSNPVTVLGKSFSAIVGVPKGLNHSAIFKQHIMIEVPNRITNHPSDYEQFIHDMERFKVMSRKFAQLLAECDVLTEYEAKELNEYFDLFVSQELMPEAEELKKECGQYMSREDYEYEQADLAENEIHRSFHFNCVGHIFRPVL